MVYDNDYIGYACAFNSQGDIELIMKATGEPGWHFYAAAVFNNHNPWWIVMPDITAYLQRVSWLLRQGQPANDVALYLPTHDAYAGFALSANPRGQSRASVNQAMDQLIGRNVIPQILDGGYNFDYIDDGAIAKVGIPYPVLVVPNVERIPLADGAGVVEAIGAGVTQFQPGDSVV